MVAILASNLVLGMPQNGAHLNWNGPAVFTIQGKSHGHTFKVRFEQANFKSRGRKLKWGPLPEAPQSYYPLWINGKNQVRLYGLDGRSKDEIAGKPISKYLGKEFTELTSMRIWFDSKRIDMPSRLFNDLLNPDFGRDNVNASFLKNGKTFTIHMDGSDGGAGYTADWKHTANGKWTRKVEGPG